MSRLCGFCKQPGHDRRTCPAYKSTELLCESTVRNDSGSFSRNVGWNNDCSCDNCELFRVYTLPTPEIACQIIKDLALARELEKKENEFPQIIVKNEMRTPIYVYSSRVLQMLKFAIEPNEQDVINYKEPFVEDEIDDYIITDHDYGNLVKFGVIEPEHILKLLTIEYGTKETVTITSKELSKEDQWREAALKANYLLEQLQRLGVQDNPNYEPIMDMVQDIDFPEYSEQDKERAGISSAFTNVHMTTDINEPVTDEPVTRDVVVNLAELMDVDNEDNGGW